MEEDKIIKLIDERVRIIFKSDGFRFRKITDTPRDDLEVVPRGYVNLSGSIAGRPTSSVAVMGQRYFATETSIPMTYNRFSSVWVNGVGSTVAQG